ncbi:MAG: pitrilysin family protein, partial [Candidatus Micrarchaeaceae archaeon]
HSIGISIGVRYGSMDDPKDLNGAAHYLEHMLFKGTKKRSWKQLNEEAEKYGFYKNAFTDHESTVYFIQSYSGYAERAFDMLSDMIANSTIEKNEFEMERGPIINENLIRADNPKFMFYDYIPAVLYRHHPAGLSVGGDNEKTIPNITIDYVKGIYEKYYTPHNMFLGIHGGITAKQAEVLADKYFGSIEGGNAAFSREAAKEPQVKRSLRISKPGIKQTRIGIGFKCSEFDGKKIGEFACMNVISNYLNKALFDSVREKEGLSYDPYAMYSAYSTFGFIASSAGIEHKNLEKAKKIMVSEYSALADGNIDKERFENSKRSISIKMSMGLDDPLSMSVAMAEDAVLFGTPELSYEFSQKVHAVPIEDALKYSERYILPDKYGEVILRPSEK